MGLYKYFVENIETYWFQSEDDLSMVIYLEEERLISKYYRQRTVNNDPAQG